MTKTKRIGARDGSTIVVETRPDGVRLEVWDMGGATLSRSDALAIARALEELAGVGLADELAAELEPGDETCGACGGRPTIRTPDGYLACERCGVHR